MHNEYYQDFQYDSCISRGICSINPRISALQTVIVLYLRIFAKYALNIELDENIKEFLLNTISTTIYNPEFNENSYLFAIKIFKKELPIIIEKHSKQNPTQDLSVEKEKAQELFQETSDIIQAIKFGEKIFRRAQENIESEIRDLYNIMLVISKSLSINLLDLKSFNKEYDTAFSIILNLLSQINLINIKKDLLIEQIVKACEINNELMKLIRTSQEERYGEQGISEVSYSTTPNKAILVVGSNIRELEIILEAFKEKDIDIYTHDDMMLAHTFPKFSEFKHLKGQFGLGLENCLLDFATFPGPIILTKHSLHNIENFYRGRLFTTDYTSSPKGIIKIENSDFSQVIECAESTKGFKKGKVCEKVQIGFNFNNTIQDLKTRIDSKKYNRIFIIGNDGYSLEQKTYFEKLIRLVPENILIISFSYNSEKNNLIHINTCFDNYSWIKIIENIKEICNLPLTVFIPKCERNTISQMICLSRKKQLDIFLGKCTPIILNPSLMNTLQKTFSIKAISSAKKDLEEILNH